jgi:heme oxygenase
MTASSELRKQTEEQHAALEDSDFGRLLFRGTLERDGYAEYLRCLWIVLATLRTQLRRHGSAKEKELMMPLDDWVSLLSEDLANLAPPPAVSNPAAHDAALAAAGAIRRHVHTCPAWIFGMAYVLYGSHLGNSLVADAISRGLELPDDLGTRYLRATEVDRALWRQFKSLLDGLVDNQKALDSAVRGAQDTFVYFRQIFDALSSAAASAARVTALNPEAGNHPIVEDADQLQVAIDVGSRCHAAWGYLQCRFGERGERYARSDGAWLATLCSLPEEVARRQVEWLARLLSARGVPSVCLEHHLMALHEAFAASTGAAPPNVARLARLSGHVGGLRVWLDRDANRDLIDSQMPGLDPRGAELLVAAVLDEREGIAPCASNIGAWARSSSVLAQTERAAVIAFIEEARSRCEP